MSRERIRYPGWSPVVPTGFPPHAEKSMADRTLLINAFTVPRFLYGTAWKEDETPRLVELALRQGFRGIDTANQRRHYHEAAVGQAMSAAFESGLVTRDDLFLQTKFTFQPGQDHRLPYDPDASIAVQVEQSLASSLEHLRVDVIDSLRAPRPQLAHRSGSGGPRSVASDGGRSRQRPGAPARSKQRDSRTAPTPPRAALVSGRTLYRTAATPRQVGTAEFANSAPRMA